MQHLYVHRGGAACARSVFRVLAVATLFLLGVADRGEAAPVFGRVGPLRQPDGTTVNVRVWGDEFYKIIESLDGYTLVRDPATGMACYARLSADGHELISTGVRVQDSAPPELELVPGIRVTAEASQAAAAEARAALARHDAEVRAALGVGLRAGPPSTGNVLAITLLIDFSDDPWTIPWQNVDNYCNQVGYTGYGNNGSVRDYYFDVSNGAMTYTNYVTPYYYRALQTKAYYSNPAIPFGQRARELILEALNHLESTVGHDFSVYDSNADSLIDGINVYYAGFVNNDWAEGLWPHSSSIGGFSADGKSTYRYQFTDMGNSLQLGTFCHENGHMMCYWPDLYDYDYDSTGVGQFCLMCYYGSNTNPVQPCAYLKYKAGWSNPTILQTLQTGLHALSTGNVSFKYNHPSNPLEYYIIENRQKTGRDLFLPDRGLAIWHVDEAGSNNWNQMQPSQHFECTLVQADGLWQLENDVNYGDANDLYAAPEKTASTPDTTPNTDWWSGAPSGMYITEVSTTGPDMTFNFGAAEDCNGNGTADICELDCDGLDGNCNLPGCGLSADCNLDGRPDECGVNASCEVEKIAGSGPSTLFGWTVAASDDVTIVGAYNDGCPTEEFACGSAEVYRFDGAQWNAETTLTASDAGEGDYFGASIAVDGDVAVIGAYGDACPAGVLCGAAYVFRFNGSSWVPEQKLTATTRAAFAYFGYSVDVDANLIAIGAFGESCAGGAECGAVYSFRYNGSSWSQEAKLTADDAAAGDNLGVAVSVSGFKLFAGADGDDCPGGGNCGSAYYFLYWNNAWSQEQKLTPPSGLDGYGSSILVDGTLAVVGAPWEDCADGDGCGAAYVYRSIAGDWEPETKFTADTPATFEFFGQAVAHRNGVLMISNYGDACPGGEYCGSAYIYRDTGLGWSPDATLVASDAATGQLLGVSGALGANETVVLGADGAAYGFVVGGPDCNCNAALDLCEIVAGTEDDDNGNGIPDLCESGPPLPAPHPYNRATNRYLSFDPNPANSGFNVAFQVEIKSLDLGSCSGNGAPCRLDHGNADCNTCSMTGDPCLVAVDCLPAGQSCNSTGQVCTNDQAASIGQIWWVGPESPQDNDVHLLVTQPFREVSSAWPSVVHVGDCEVVPRATYGIRAVSVDTGGVSDELVAATIARPGSNHWADGVSALAKYCTGDWTPCPGGSVDCPPGESCLLQWGPPDGAANFDDVTATVFLFQSLPGLTVPDTRWVDMHGNSTGTPGSEGFDPPNYVANFSDIQFMILAFQGRPYPFYDPGDCPDIGVWP